MKTLRDVKCGTSAIVMKLHGVGAVKKKNYGYGNYKRTEVLFVKVAPLGDPIEVNVEAMNYL